MVCRPQEPSQGRESLSYALEFWAFKVSGTPQTREQTPPHSDTQAHAKGGRKNHI